METVERFDKHCPASNHAHGEHRTDRLKRKALRNAYGAHFPCLFPRYIFLKIVQMFKMFTASQNDIKLSLSLLHVLSSSFHLTFVHFLN